MIVPSHWPAKGMNKQNYRAMFGVDFRMNSKKGQTTTLGHFSDSVPRISVSMLIWLVLSDEKNEQKMAIFPTK